MKILALETSSEICSVALWQDGEVLGSQRQDRMHSTSVLPMFDAILAEAQTSLSDMDAIAFGRGPGMFTGIRIGAGIAQGVAFAADKPVIPVSSLHALAESVGAEQVFVAQDARMNEVYCCAYIRNPESEQLIMEPLMEEQLSKPDTLTLPGAGEWVLAGTACRQYRQYLLAMPGVSSDRMFDDLYPNASWVARIASRELALGSAVSPEVALPVYLRDKVAKKKGEI